MGWFEAALGEFGKLGSLPGSQCRARRGHRPLQLPHCSKRLHFSMGGTIPTRCRFAPLTESVMLHWLDRLLW